MGTHPIFESDFDCLTVMSSGDRLKGLLNDFKKSGSTSVNIGNDTGDDEATQGLLGGISGWTNSGFSKFKSSMTKVSDSLPTSVKNLTETSGDSWFKQAEEDPYCPSLSKKQRIIGFMSSMGMGVLCFSMALAYLPILLVAARKFALLYTLGSIFFISSFSFLYGPKKHFKHLLSSERLPFTSSYVLSMCFTLYAAMGIKSYILTIIAAGIQCVALTYFTLSYIPGGQAAIKFMAKITYAICSRCFKTVTNV